MKRRLYAIVSVALLAVGFAAWPANGSTLDHYTVVGSETWRQIAAKLSLPEAALTCANRTSAATCPKPTDQPGAGRIIHLPAAVTPPSSSTSTTTAPTTTTTTTVAPATTTTVHTMDCDGIPMDTPIGALPPAMPMFCDQLAAGIPGTFVNGPNSWVDDFQHGASMADLGPGYAHFEKSSLETGESGTFRHNNHWMADVYAPGGNVGGSQMRPDRSFKFENGKLVVETDVAAGVAAYGGFAWPELTVTLASSPASEPYGPTPARSIGDDLYAYGQFGGYDTVGIRLHGRRPITAYYDSTERGFPCGRRFEISWYQDGDNPDGAPDCAVKEPQFSIWGGGEWMNPPGGGWRECGDVDPDINCRDRFRWEITRTTLTLFVNGVKYMEHVAHPGYELPDALVNGEVYVYFSDWVYQGPNRVVRFHWGRVAVNPGSV